MIALALVVSASWPGAAQGKDIRVFEVCGESGCKRAPRQAALSWEGQARSFLDPTAFYTVQLGFIERPGGTLRPGAQAYWVPGPGRLALADQLSGCWYNDCWLELSRPAGSMLEKLTSGIEPFTPGLASATVGGKPAADPSSYLALLGDLPRSFVPNAGSHLLRIVLRPAAPNPWIERATVVGYEPKHRLLVRSGGIFKVPKAIGSRIARRASLAGVAAPRLTAGRQALYLGMAATGLVAAIALALAVGKRGRIWRRKR